MTSLTVVLFLPLITGVFIRLFGARLGKTGSSVIGCASVLVAFAFSVAAFLSLGALAPEARHVIVPVYNFLTVGTFKAGFDLLLDPLSAVMICVVTGVGSLIHIYS